MFLLNFYQNLSIFIQNSSTFGGFRQNLRKMMNVLQLAQEIFMKNFENSPARRPSALSVFSTEILAAPPYLLIFNRIAIFQQNLYIFIEKLQNFQNSFILGGFRSPNTLQKRPSSGNHGNERNKVFVYHPHFSS